MALNNSSGIYRALINESSIANNEIVAAVASKHIVVTNLVITIPSAQTVTWKSGTDAISGPLGESYTAGDAYTGLFETASGEALNLDSVTADQVSGHLTYLLLP